MSITYGKNIPINKISDDRKIQEVEITLDHVNRNTCPKCGSTDCVVTNYSMMWHDGEIMCNKCGAFIRSFDAG